MAITVDQLLATLSVDDAATVAVTGQFALILRTPEPDEDDIAVDAPVYLRVVDLDGNPAVGWAHSVVVYADVGAGPVPVYVGGAFTGDWNQPGSSTASHGGADPYAFFDLTAAHGTDFASRATVKITVVVNANALIEVYSFRVVDVERPSLLSAEAVGQMTVRVRFDDEMGATALDPGNYTIQTENVDPDVGVSLTVESVALADTGSGYGHLPYGHHPYGHGYWDYDLTVNWEMTPNCPYRVICDDSVVTDASGNLLIRPAEAVFSGYAPDTPATRRWDLYEMLPEVLQAADTTQDLRRIINVFQETTDLLLYDIDHSLDQVDPDTATDEQIALMLWDLGNPWDVDEYDLTAAQQRLLTTLLVPIYRLRGTAEGIESAVFLLTGITVSVVDYLSDQWQLGYDALGTGQVAYLTAGSAETYDFTGAPLTLTVEVDGGGAQTVTFQPSDFLSPTAGTAEEVAARLTADLTDAEGYVHRGGVPAEVTCTGTEPFAATAGDDLQLSVNGAAAQTLTLSASDYAASGSVTADEIADWLNDHLVGASASASGGSITIATDLTGATATIQVTGGTLVGIMTWPGAAQAGADTPRAGVFSTTPGPDGRIEVTGGTANAVLDFGTEPSVAIGGCKLGPSASRARYCFDLETSATLTTEEERLVRQIAEELKPAHTHLISIRPPAAVTVHPDGWHLGWSKLGTTTVLGP